MNIDHSFFLVELEAISSKSNGDRGDVSLSPESIPQLNGTWPDASIVGCEGRK